MSGIQLSIVIPVCNKWELTRQCLVSLAATLSEDDFEVFVVDNASTDDTASACEPTGRALFGERFQVLRQESNRNFAAACNIGARAARGDRLFFLNNDTVALEGWRNPLESALNELGQNACPGAVGPLLLYPSAFGFRDRVQHLGIHFDPDLKVGHAHEYIAADHPLARKRRRFQAITAAALLMPRSLFERVDGFYEGFINGFEDVDLCLRLGALGYRFAVEPQSRFYHLCGQTPGRGSHDAANAALLTSRCKTLVTPDSHSLLKADGYRLRLSAWLTFETVLSEARTFALSRLLRGGDEASLRAAIADEPYWREGYAGLADALESRGGYDEAFQLRLLAAQLWLNPDQLLPLYALAQRMAPELLPTLAEKLRRFAIEPEERAKRLRQRRLMFRTLSPELAADADQLLSGQRAFLGGAYRLLSESLARIDDASGLASRESKASL